MATKSAIVKSIKKMVGIQYDVTEQPQYIPVVPDDFDQANGGKSKSYGELLGELSPHLETKKQIYDTYTKLRPIIEPLLNKVVVDVLHKGRTDGEEFITIKYEGNPEIESILIKQVETFRLELQIIETLFDALLYGEYYQKIDYTNNELDDCYEYNDIMPVYSAGKIKKTMKVDQSGYSSKDNKDIDHKELYIISISMPGYRIRLKVKDKENGSKYYLRIPSPFVPTSAIGLLMSISIMEKLIPLIQLMKLDRGQLVTIPVPVGTPINQMFDICREYEKQINTRMKDSITSLTFESIDDIVSSFGKYKVLPSVQGTGQKASMDSRDLPAARDVQFSDFDYLLTSAANRIGVPLSYMVSGTTIQDDPKATLQYLMKLRFIREKIADSIFHFLCNYVSYRRQNKGDAALSEFKAKNLEVILPVVPGTESIASVDYMDAMSATLNNVQTIISNFGSVVKDPPAGLDISKMMDIVNGKLRPILGQDVFDLSVYKKGGYEAPPPEEPPPEGEEQ